MDFEPDESREGYHWWRLPPPKPHRGHIPAALFGALEGGESDPAYGCRTYPTREAAVSALAAARAKAGGGDAVRPRVEATTYADGSPAVLIHVHGAAGGWPIEDVGGRDVLQRFRGHAELLAALRTLLSAVGDCGYDCRQGDVVMAIHAGRAAVARAEASP